MALFYFIDSIQLLLLLLLLLLYRTRLSRLFLLCTVQDCCCYFLRTYYYSVALSSSLLLPSLLRHCCCCWTVLILFSCMLLLLLLFFKLMLLLLYRTAVLNRFYIRFIPVTRILHSLIAVINKRRGRRSVRLIRYFWIVAAAALTVLACFTGIYSLLFICLYSLFVPYHAINCLCFVVFINDVNFVNRKIKIILV